MLTPEQISHAWSASFDDPDNRDLQTLFARAIESLVTKKKDKEIERLNAVTNLQLETITDLEDRLEKTRNEAMEEAASLCEKIDNEWNESREIDTEDNPRGKELAIAIRALQSSPAQSVKVEDAKDAWRKCDGKIGLNGVCEKCGHTFFSVAAQEGKKS